VEGSCMAFAVIGAKDAAMAAPDEVFAWLVIALA
jgi:hypothetical protein